MPYQHAGNRYSYRFEGKTVVGKKRWELHYESIAHDAADWRRLSEESPSRPLVVAGDVNQNRDGQRWYGTKKGRDLLGLALAGADMNCVTERKIQPMDGDPLPPTIDHICLERGLAFRLT